MTNLTTPAPSGNGKPPTPYEEFLKSKTVLVPASGIEVQDADIHPMLFPFQRDLTRWALRKGRSAIFASTGLGKTFMQVEWARLTGKRTLILAPLAVAKQTVREAQKIGVEVVYARKQDDAGQITIANYEMVDHFDPAAFPAVVLEESSILKSLDGKTRTKLIDLFGRTPYRLCCTATPAPNDIAELANHAEFLGIMSRVEMLAKFFVHDDSGWRLKGHARQPFYKWLASWGMSLRKPSDLGYDDTGFDLPPLSICPLFVDADFQPSDRLFSVGLKGITDRANTRKATLKDRVEAAVGLVDATPEGEPWVLWCGLNDEQNALEKAFGQRCFSVYGTLEPEEKASRLERWIDGERPILLTKCSVAGFGLNLQHCARMAFVGLSDSYEQYFQAIRRCWRFGQKRPVEAHIILSDAEEAIYTNVRRKEEEADRLGKELVKHVAEYERAEIETGQRTDTYEPNSPMRLPSWLKGSKNGAPVLAVDQHHGENHSLYCGDSAELLKALPSDSVDLSIYSPPFAHLFVYSPTERDLGNSADDEEFFRHYGYVTKELLRVMKPGRNTCVHVAQVTNTKVTHGEIGLRDFRGEVIRHMVEQGFIYHGEVCIQKSAQVQAIRTKSKCLLFVQKDRDSSWLRPALADYICVFRKPGENAVPVKSDISNDEWIEWAAPIWLGIRETNTLNVAEARSEDDERHICPLQLQTIERCIRLWSNPGEVILSPFGGIGSEPYQAVMFGRKGIGCELKPEYFACSVRNLCRAEHDVKQPSLFDGIDEPAGVA